jgi:hypothetical protein
VKMLIAASRLTWQSSGHGAATCWVPSTIPFRVRVCADDRWVAHEKSCHLPAVPSEVEGHAAEA